MILLSSPSPIPRDTEKDVVRIKDTKEGKRIVSSHFNNELLGDYDMRPCHCRELQLAIPRDNPIIRRDMKNVHSDLSSPLFAFALGAGNESFLYPVWNKTMNHVLLQASAVHP